MAMHYLSQAEAFRLLQAALVAEKYPSGSYDARTNMHIKVSDNNVTDVAFTVSVEPAHERS